MNIVTRKIHDFLNNTWVLLVLALLTAIGALWPIFQEGKFGPRIVAWIMYGAAMALYAIALVYSIRVRQENSAFRRIPDVLHRVNHDYRNVLSVVFGDPDVVPSEDERIRAELKTLGSVCQKLAGIYRELTHVHCTVTVKLITREDGGRAYCETLVRSEMNCPRDEGQPHRYELNTSQNLAFDRALRFRPGRMSYFFSADLTKESTSDYSNQRQEWKDYYVSTIVGPIRYVKPGSDGHPAVSDDIGFLAVDTLSPNRLNDGYHVQLLAAFADQMYNFMSLMRGKFEVSRGPRREHQSS